MHFEGAEHMYKQVLRGSVAVLLSWFLAAPLAAAQGAGGTIAGTVKDETGAVIPGANVTVRQTETGATREVVTDSAGRYTATNVAPGPYEVTAALEGFSTIVRSGIRLTVGREAVVDFTLSAGQVQD